MRRILCLLLLCFGHFLLSTQWTAVYNCLEKGLQKGLKVHVIAPKVIEVSVFLGHSFLTSSFQGNLGKCHCRDEAWWV